MATYVESRRRTVSRAAATPDDADADRLTAELLARVAHELAVDDRDGAERWIDASPADVRSAARISRTLGILAAALVRDVGFDHEALAYLVARSAELSRRAAANAHPASVPARPDPTAHLAAASVAVVEAFDRTLGDHARAVGTWSARLVRAAGGEADLQRAARDVATIGDLGKLTLPPSLLEKRGRLDPQDWAMIGAVPAAGAAVAERIPIVADLAPVVLARRERFDGRGLVGLSGERLPVLARVVAVADAFYAMICDRPYRPRLDVDLAIGELQRGAGSLFDGRIVAELVEIVRPAAVSRPRLRAINGGSSA